MMPAPFADAWAALRRPADAFRPPPPTLGRALGAMLVLWTPPALANALLSTWEALQAYGTLRSEGLPPAWARLSGLDPGALRQLMASLPPPPDFNRIWPWLLLAVPLSLLGAWLHHAVWDHTGLWMLGGLKGKHGFRASLLAEAQALRVASLGSLASLLGFVPWLGAGLAVPLLLLDGYLWIFRGFALAARHGCEPWRGVAATVLHAVLFGAFILVVAALLLLTLRMGA